MNNASSDVLRIAITGAGGQLGKTLVTCQSGLAEPVRSRLEILPLTRSELDVSDEACVKRILSSLRPHAILNCAAYTAVDRAEQEPELAYAINETGPKNLAAYCLDSQTTLIHVSTDFVFDGSARSAYAPGALTNPLGVYGASKLAGEEAVVRVLGERASIVRSSWVYSATGHNFVLTMLRLMQEKATLSVVDDQFGSPTSTSSLANVLLTMAMAEDCSGLYHWCDGASISWHAFAEEIQKQALEAGLLAKPVTVSPVPTSGYPTPARRPAYSVLDRAATLRAFSITPTDWRTELNKVIEKIAVTQKQEKTGNE